MICRELLAYEMVNGGLLNCESEALCYLSQAHCAISQLLDDLMAGPTVCNGSTEVMLTGSVGRPAYCIPYNQLLYLIESRFSVPEIANLLGVSVSTIRRRMTLYGLSIRATHTPIADTDLDHIFATAQQEFPSWGN